MMATSRRRGCAAPRVVLSISPRADSETRPSFSGTPPKASSLNLGGVVSSSMAKMPRARWVFPQLFPSNTSLKRGAATNLLEVCRFRPWSNAWTREGRDAGSDLNRPGSASLPLLREGPHEGQDALGGRHHRLHPPRRVHDSRADAARHGSGRVG